MITKTNTIAKRENQLVKMNKIMLQLSFVFVGMYGILLATTSVVVIRNKALATHINENKIKISDAGSYSGGGIINSIATLDDVNFAEPGNVIYVDTGKVDLVKNVAFQTSKK